MFRNTLPEEDIIAQDQAGRTAIQKLFRDDKGVGQAARLGLFGKTELNSPLAAAAQQKPEERQILRGADDQDLANARQHERGKRIIDHRLVIDRQQLFADCQGDRMQARALAARQDDALHFRPSTRPV